MAVETFLPFFSDGDWKLKNRLDQSPGGRLVWVAGDENKQKRRLGRRDLDSKLVSYAYGEPTSYFLRVIDEPAIVRLPGILE